MIRIRRKAQLKKMPIQKQEEASILVEEENTIYEIDPVCMRKKENSNQNETKTNPILD